MMLCWFLLHSNVNWLYEHAYPLLLNLLSTAPCAVPLVIKHGAAPPVLCSSFPLAGCSTRGSVSMSMLIHWSVIRYVTDQAGSFWKQNGHINKTLAQQANLRAVPGKWEHRGPESQSSHQAIWTLWSVFSYEVSSAPIKKNCLHSVCSGKCDSICTQQEISLLFAT